METVRGYNSLVMMVAIHNINTGALVVSDTTMHVEDHFMDSDHDEE